MKNIKLSLLATTAAVLLSGNAMAQEAGKFYTSIHGEVAVHSDSDIDVTSSVVNDSGSTDFDLGFGIGGAVGYNLTNNIRVEGELTYRETDVDSVTFGSTTIPGGNLQLELWTATANTYYNYPLNDKVSPYVGAGIGAAYNDNISEFAFAYQGMAGVDYKVNDQGTVYGGYRYFGATDFEDRYAGITTKTDVSQHIIEFGYRYTF